MYVYTYNQYATDVSIVACPYRVYANSRVFVLDSQF